MPVHLECTVCKVADLEEVASGVLECGHVFCAECTYKLWHAETAAATARREARAHQARLHAQTRAQVEAHAQEDAADNGRNLRCPCCQRCSSVDSVRRVFLSSTQAPSTVSAASPQVLTRSNSATSASAEEAVEDLSAQLAAALEHLDAAHAHAAESARAHDLHMHQMQTQLMAHAEQAHQSQVQGLAETNARLERELRNAQAQLNHAAREVNDMRDQFGRAVQELSQAREKARVAKARASDAMVKTRDAAVDRLADRLSANGSLGAPLRSGMQTTETVRQTKSKAIPQAPAPPASSNIRKPRENDTQRDPGLSPRTSRRAPVLAPEASSKAMGNRDPAPTTVKVQSESASVSGGTRSRRSELSTTAPSRVRALVKNDIEQKPKPEDRANGPASRHGDALCNEGYPKRQTRATSSTKTKSESQNKSKTDAEAPSANVTTAAAPAPSDDYRNPDTQHSLRERALAAGRRWPISEKIVVPPCSTDFKHDFKGKGSNSTYLKHKCAVCNWGCEERTPEGYVPERQRRGGKSNSNQMGSRAI